MKTNIREFLPIFIRRQFERGHGCRWDWNAHVRSYLESDRSDIPLLKYEEMLLDPFNATSTAIRQLTGDEEIDEECLLFSIKKYSFEKQTGRKQGQEQRNSFARKGQAGDWRNYFTREAAMTFDELAGQTLIDLGYEHDRAWIDQCETE